MLCADDKTRVRRLHWKVVLWGSKWSTVFASVLQCQWNRVSGIEWKWIRVTLNFNNNNNWAEHGTTSLLGQVQRSQPQEEKGRTVKGKDWVVYKGMDMFRPWVLDDSTPPPPLPPRTELPLTIFHCMGRNRKGMQWLDNKLDNNN